MKKSVIPFLLAMSMGCCVGVGASELNLEGATFAFHDGSKLIEKSKDPAFGSSNRTTDVVKLEEDTLTIQTELGVSITYEPGEGVVLLTQDLFQDLATYVTFCDEPKKVCQNFIDNHIHLNVFNEAFDIYVGVEEPDLLGTVVGDANDLSESDAEYLVDYLEEETGLPFTVGLLGEQVWFLGDAIEEGGSMYLFTWVNENLVSAIIHCYDLDRLEEPLAEVERMGFSAA